MNWNTLAIIDLGLASVLVYVGLYHLATFLMRPADKANLAFASTAVSIGAYTFANAMIYAAPTPEAGVFWFLVQMAVAAVAISSIVWFCYFQTGRVYWRATLGFTAVCCSMFALSIALWNTSYTAEYSKPLRLELAFFGLYQGTVFQGVAGVVPTGLFLTILCVFVFSLVVFIREYIKARTSQNLVLVLGFLGLLVAGASDVFFATGVYAFIGVGQYAYFVLVAGMAYALLSSFVSLHSRVERMNEVLEERVKDRTASLSTALQQLETSNGELALARDALWGEMRVARKIQTALLPDCPHIVNYDIAAVMNPAEEVGGDYYDVINVEGRDWVVIGDVSGHGVPAGLIMMMVQTSIRTVLRQHPGVAPSSLLATVNRVIFENIQTLREDKYMTIMVLAYGEEGTFRFAGNHQDILIYRSRERAVEVVESCGVWIGIVEDVGQMNPECTVALGANDVMVLYTDGATEAVARNSDGCGTASNLFGVSRLSQAVQQAAVGSAASVVEGILRALDGYECSDDVTILAIKRVA